MRGGTIGSAVVREALDRGHTVTAVVRDRAKVTERHANLTVTTGDVLDGRSVAAAAEGQDVVVSAVGGSDGPGHLATIKPAAVALTEGLRPLGAQAPRLITVGGAGSLRTPDGKQVWDAPDLPDFLLQIMHAHGDALDHYRTVTDVDWTSISPAAMIEPGTRTGVYRTALDDLVTDDDGNSTISVEDYAVALLDEIEQPRHRRQRFAVGY
ncbi:NAD(P)-dependent oxidoreductase [Streptomyces sp. NPDC056987]|uniref:NAD(P)-dependent oxidoreductase n=1 Tax=Streptomyces sp. NPDC056987 TaxID=3345988 RepID=UPI00362D57AF